MTDENAEQMLKMYDELYDVMGNWLTKDREPLAVAAVLMATALRMYRTALSADDFDQMMDYLSDTRDNIEKFPSPEEINSKLN